MRFLSKIEVVDSNGNEFSEMTGPIPFYIRVHLEDGMNRYRVRLIDDKGNTRGQYSGVTAQKHLDLYVPFIKLPKPGKLRILVEESAGEPKYSHQHQISILYLEYTPEKNISNKPSLLESTSSPTEGESISPSVSNFNFSNSHIKEEFMNPTEIDENQFSLTKDEFEYLAQRERILKETNFTSENKKEPQSIKQEEFVASNFPFKTEEEE